VRRTADLALILALLTLTCTSHDGTTLPCRPETGAIETPSLPAESLPAGLASAMASFPLKPSSEVAVERVLLSGDTAFVLFTFQESGRDKRSFGSFVKKGASWSADQVATDLWRVPPAACSGHSQLLSIQTSGVSCTAGFVDPTVDRVDVMVGSELVGQDHPLGGRVLVLAPVGSLVSGYRQQQFVWSSEVKNLQPTP
jgi:hypothetical protein